MIFYRRARGMMRMGLGKGYCEFLGRAVCWKEQGVVDIDAKALTAGEYAKA
jgi:hypothetical protein